MQISIEISMVKVNVVMACKIVKSLQVVAHAKLIIQRGLCKEIKIPKKKNGKKTNYKHQKWA